MIVPSGGAVVVFAVVLEVVGFWVVVYGKAMEERRDSAACRGVVVEDMAQRGDHTARQQQDVESRVDKKTAGRTFYSIELEVLASSSCISAG